MSGSSPNNEATLVHKGGSISIYRICIKEEEADDDSDSIDDIARTSGVTGYKVVHAENTTEEPILRLLHEEQISNYLPPICATRKARQIKSFCGQPALEFDWIDGITLRDWLEQNRIRSFCSAKDQDQEATQLRKRLNIAIAITQTLCNFHQAGVSHQSISLDHIILSTYHVNKRETRVIANLISLSNAVLIPELLVDESRGVLQEDLQHLGHVMNALFSVDDEEGGKSATAQENNDGEITSSESTIAVAEGIENIFVSTSSGPMSKRGKHHGQGGEGCPLYLKSIISALILADRNYNDFGTANAYENVHEVLLDLQAAEKKPLIYAKPSTNRSYTIVPGESNHRLQIPTTSFYGRQSELFELLRSFNTVIKVNGQPALTCVSGYGGSGKTSLVSQIRGPLEEARGYFIRGKFDLSARPDSVLTESFNEFFGVLVESEDEDEKNNMKARIQESIRVDGCSVLMELIPNLAKLLKEPEDEDSDSQYTHSSQSDLNQWKFLLCKLIGAMADQSRPIALFFDDLQWADSMSLDLIQMMVADPDTRYCHYLACYRDEEAESKERVETIIDGIEAQGVNVTRIKLGAMDATSINALVSENLNMPPSLCRSLSDIIHNKTCGIILFVINYLKTLNDEGLLRYNLTSLTWEYGKELIQSKTVDEDGVSHYLTQQMNRLDHRNQLALKVAACFGFSIDSNILESALLGLGIENEALDDIVRSGFLQKLSHKYIWAHDQVRQAAYDLISEERRKSFHLLIGARLLMNTPPDQLDNAVFDIVFHMNIGATLMKAKSQRQEVAMLNVMAGEKAINSFSFHSAAEYLLAAISLQGEEESEQEENYNLLMKIYNLLLKPLFAIGNFTTLGKIIDKTLALSNSSEESMNAYTYQARLLSASGKYEDAISTILNLLQQYGETIPTHMTKDLLFKEMIEVRTLLAKYSESELIALPLMTDESKLMAMQFLNEAFTMGYHFKSMLLPIIVFRMIKLSIEYGLCELSAMAFICYGSLLTLPLNEDINSGYRMGRMAIAIMEQLDANKLMARIYMTMYGTLAIWKEPFQSGLEQHLKGHDQGALVGDMEFSLWELHIYTCTAVLGCGENLLQLKSNIPTYIRRALQHKHPVIGKCMCVLYSLVLQLTRSKEDCYSTYFHCAEDDFFTPMHDKTGMGTNILLCHKKVFMAVFSRNLGNTAQWLIANHRKKYPEGGTNPRFVGALYAEFMQGLVAFYFARNQESDDQDEWEKLGVEAIKLMKRWTDSSNWNFSNKLALLQAEYYFFKDSESDALEKYQAAINAARNHRFVHEEGLANSLAASFHLHYGREKEALEHFTHAKRCYECWGATALVDLIEDEMKSLV